MPSLNFNLLNLRIQINEEGSENLIHTPKIEGVEFYNGHKIKGIFIPKSWVDLCVTGIYGSDFIALHNLI